ncbi:hypothetical protein JB92DRAFT_3013432 [Gautieria morchelliformis]|nr:hypothetical protein JB92DRAFT_3013432 [Gautieria morchelliformis]
MQAELPLQDIILARTGSVKMLHLFNLNLKPTVGVFVQWIRSSHGASRAIPRATALPPAAVMTSRLTLSTFPYEGGDKHFTDIHTTVDLSHLESTASPDSDSLADTDSDCTLKNVGSIDSRSSLCDPLHDYDSNPLYLATSGNPAPLIDSHVFVFRTHSRAHSRTDDLDFWCAGEDRKLRRGSLPFGARGTRCSRTRPRSMPPRTSWSHESHVLRIGAGIPLGHTPTRPPRRPLPGVTALGNGATRCAGPPSSNKWGKHPPAGYI